MLTLKNKTAALIAEAASANFGAGLLCAGFGILWLFLCIGTTKGIVWLTKVFIKSLLIPKGDK